MVCRIPEGVGPIPGLGETAGPRGALVFVADPAVGDDWEDVLAELTAAFEMTQAALGAGAPVVYVVDQRDLLGQRGAGSAMVASGLLSAARSAADEARRDGVPVNVIATGADTPAAALASGLERLLAPEGGGPTGELIRLGGDHLGKALP